MADRQAQVECGVIGVTDAFDVGLKLARGSAERAHLARARRDLAMLKAGAGSVRVGMASVISGLGRPGGGVVAQGSGRPQMMSGAADGRPGASGASASPRTFAEVAKRSEFGHLFVSSPGNSVASTRRDLSSDRPMQKTVAIKPTALPLAFHASALRNHRAAHGTPKAAAKAGRGALPNDAAQAISPPLKPVTGNQHTAHSSLAPQVYDSAVAPIVSDARATAARVKWERPASGGSVNAGVTGIGTVGTPPTRSIISAAAALLARGAPDRGTNFGDAARPRSSRHTDAVPGTAPMVAGHEPRAGGRRRAAAQPFAPPAATFQTAASKAPAAPTIHQAIRLPHCHMRRPLREASHQPSGACRMLASSKMARVRYKATSTWMEHCLGGGCLVRYRVKPAGHRLAEPGLIRGVARCPPAG